MTRKIPRHAFIDEGSYFHYLYRPRSNDNPLYREIAKAFHDALPDEVANCLTDELMNAEVRGELERFRIENHMDKVLDAFVNVLRRVALPMEDEDGTAVLAVPLEEIKAMRNGEFVRRLLARRR